MLPGNHFFNIPYVIQLSGELNVEALEKALEEVVQRHEALRTVFGEVEGNPFQIIKDGADIRLTVYDYRNQSPDESSERAAALILDERQTHFDLVSGPLLRAKLARLTETESFLILNFHHIVSDHWSIQIFRRELAILYEAFLRRRASPLPSLQIQFADYASWERQLLRRDYLDVQLKFWKQQLTSSFRSFDSTSPSTQGISHLTTHSRIEFDLKLLTAVRQLAKVANSTPFIVLVAALAIVLHKCDGRRDIRIGTLTANRRQRQTQFTIGHFVNSVVLDLQITPGITHKNLLDDVRSVFLTAVSNEVVPFEHVASVLELEHNIPRTSLFRVLLIYNQVETSYEMPGLTFACLDFSRVKNKGETMLTSFDLIIDVIEAATKLTGSVNYGSAYFETDIAKALVQRVQSLTNDMMALVD